jgi:hypothetical protein
MSRIAIYAQFNEPFRKVANLTIPVMQEYADRHGYDLHVGENLPIHRSIVWDRYKILRENLDRYDWIAHFDSDVLLTNLNIRLEEFCHEPSNVVISMATTEKGERRMNDGVALFRKDWYTHHILDECFHAPQEGSIQCGQDKLEMLYLTRADNHTFHIERQKAINSFLYSEYGLPETTVGSWGRGDFCLHLPGRTNDRRVELFTEHLNYIIR